MTNHDHPPDGDCQPSCPAWCEGVLELGALLRRYDAMLAACRTAAAIEYVAVVPATPGTELPESLKGEAVVRLNLVVGRDCPEVMLDEWGIRTTLTFRGRRHDCAIPWAAVKGGLLASPPRPKRRFGVVEGGAGAVPAAAPPVTPPEPQTEAPGPAPAPAPKPRPLASAPVGEPGADEDPGPATPAPTRPRPVFGLIPGGKSDKKD